MDQMTKNLLKKPPTRPRLGRRPRGTPTSGRSWPRGQRPSAGRQLQILKIFFITSSPGPALLVGLGDVFVQKILATSGVVQVFGRRDAETIPTLGQPASEKRQ